MAKKFSDYPTATTIEELDGKNLVAWAAPNVQMNIPMSLLADWLRGVLEEGGGVVLPIPTTGINVTWAAGFANGVIPEETAPPREIATLSAEGGSGHVFTIAEDSTGGAFTIVGNKLVLSQSLAFSSYPDGISLTLAAQNTSGSAVYSQVVPTLLEVAESPTGPAVAWYETGKFRQKPPVLIGPLTRTFGAGSAVFGDTDLGQPAGAGRIYEDNDYIFRCTVNGGRTSLFKVGGLNQAWMIGGNLAAASSATDYRCAIYRVKGHWYAEGVAHRGTDNSADDAWQMQGGDSPSKRGHFSFNRCEALGIHGTNKAFNSAVNASSIRRSGATTYVTVSSSITVSSGQVVRVWGTTGTDAVHLNGTYKAASSQTVAAGQELALAFYGFGSSVSRTISAHGGSIRVASMTGTTSRHGDCWQIDTYYSYTGTLSMDYCTGESAYQGVLAGWNQSDQKGNNNLLWTRCNMRVYDEAPEPQDINAYLGYIGGQTGNRDRPYIAGLLRDVWVEVRTSRDWATFTLAGSGLHPPSGWTRTVGGSTQVAGAVSENGDQQAYFPLIVNLLDINGQPGRIKKGVPPAGDFSRLTGGLVPATMQIPGFTYTPHLNNYANVTPAAAPVMQIDSTTIAASAANGSKIGVLRCSNFTLDPYWIKLALTNNAGGRVALNGRRLEKASTMTPGNYTVAGTAQLFPITDLDGTGAPLASGNFSFTITAT